MYIYINIYIFPIDSKGLIGDILGNALFVYSFDYVFLRPGTLSMGPGSKFHAKRRYRALRSSHG